MDDREKITQKYLFMALEELENRKGTKRRARLIKSMYEKEIVNYELYGKYEDNRKEDTNEVAAKYEVKVKPTKLRL